MFSPGPKLSHGRSGTKRTSHDAIIPRGIIPDNQISEGNFRPSQVLKGHLKLSRASRTRRRRTSEGSRMLPIRAPLDSVVASDDGGDDVDDDDDDVDDDDDDDDDEDDDDDDDDDP